MKVLLIGQAPGRGGDPSRPLLGGRVGSKLISMLGISEREYVRRFDRINALNFWPGKNGKGDRFPMREARKIALRKLNVISGRRILFVGIAAANAFGFDHALLRWRRFNGGRAAILPHPSGVNRWWNDLINRQNARRFMRRVAHLR